MFYLILNLFLRFLLTFMEKLTTAFNLNRKYFKNDALAGITVALALIPEAIAFAFVAGVSPLLSLQTAVVVALVAALLTGRPGMISASTAAIAVVLAPLIAEYGLEYLFATVVLMGILQALMGLTKLGKFTSLIPYSVVLGFLNGLALVIFFAQWEQFRVKEMVLIDGVEKMHEVWMPVSDLTIMLGFVGLTMLIIHFFPRVTKAVPSSLVAIGTVTAISVLLAKFGFYQLTTVADFAGMKLEGALPSFHLPQIALNWDMLKIIFPYAFVAALVGLTEAALTLRVVDDMTNTKGKMDREFFAQGFANLASGFTGGMGGCAMIGQSIINIQSGARTRFSGLVAASALLFFIMLAGPLVNAIPLASLIGLMFMVVIVTFKWESLKYGKRIPLEDYIVIGVVTVATVFLDLATAVIIGVLMSTVMFAWEKGKRLEFSTHVRKDGCKVYQLDGILFFGSVLNFKDSFTVKDDPKSVILDLKNARVMDFSALEAIDSVAQKYKAEDKRFRIVRPGENCLTLLENAENITAVKIDKKFKPESRACEC